MPHDPKRRAVLVEALIAAGLTVLGFATGQDPLVVLAVTAAGVGGSWAANLADQGFQHWCNGWFTRRGALNRDIARALSQALQDAVRQLERDWKTNPYYQHLQDQDPEAAEGILDLLGWLREDAKTLFEQPDRLTEVLQRDAVSALVRQGEAGARRLLSKAVQDYFDPDDELRAFVQARLVDEWLLRFGEALKDPGEDGTRAWRACQLLWQASLTAAVDQMQRDAAETVVTVRWPSIPPAPTATATACCGPTWGRTPVMRPTPMRCCWSGGRRWG
jgi:hypothetical protein